MNIEDGTEYLGNSWIKCRSKSHSGHNYYFNTVTGESTWNLSDVELEKSPRSTKNHEEKPKNVHIDGCPEPKGPPEAHSEQVRYSKEKSVEMNQASGSKTYNSQIISNKFPKQSYPFAPYVTHVVSPNVAASLGLGISTPGLNANMWPVPPTLIVAHSISTMTSPAHSSTSQENHISVQRMAASQPTYAQPFNIPSSNSYQRQNNFSRKGRGNIQKKGQAYQNRYKWTENDLRHKLSANKCSKSFRHQGEYIEEGSEDDPNHFDEYEQASVSKVIYTKQEEEEDNSYCSDADSDWLEEHLEGPDLTLNITNLKQLAASNADPDCWFIAADTSILSRHLHFLHILVNSDTQCHLMVPQDVLSELQAIVNVGNGLHRKKYRAKRASEFLSRQLQTGRAVMGQVSSDSNHFENFIINCCLNLKRQSYHVVLLSNNPELQIYKNTTDIPIFTISQVKKFLSSKIAKRHEENTDHSEEAKQLETLKALEPSFKKPIAMPETHKIIADKIVMPNIEITINNDAKMSNIDKEAAIMRAAQVTDDGKTSQIEKLNPSVQTSTSAIDKEAPINRPAQVTDDDKTYQTEKRKVVFQTSTSAIDEEAPIKQTAQVTVDGKTSQIEKLKPSVQTSTGAIEKEAPIKRTARVADNDKTYLTEKRKVVVQTSSSAIDKEAPIKRTAQVTDDDKTYQIEKLKVVVQTFTSAESDRTKNIIESNTIPIRRKIQLKRSTSNQASSNIDDRVDKKNIKLWRKSRYASIQRTESQLSSAYPGNPVNTADNTNLPENSTLIDKSKTFRAVSELTENDTKNLPTNTESLRNSDIDSSAFMQNNTDTVNLTASASLYYGNSETSSSGFVQTNIDPVRLPRNRETNRSSFIHKHTETTNSPRNMIDGNGIGTSSDFMQRNIDATNLPTDDMLVENSDSCSSVFMQTTTSRENITLEETSTSGIISNTTNNSQTNIGLNHELINAVDQNIIFDIIDQNMEDYLRVRRDEWVSRFVQIMEEVLTQVLQQDPEFLPHVMPPPWNIFEATRCLYVRFRNNNDVIDAANKFSKILFKISHGTDRIDVETITPSEYIILYSYGVYLVDILQSIYKNSEDLQTASKSLSKLFSDIRDCNQNETFVDNPHEYSESSDQRMSVSATVFGANSFPVEQDGEARNRREVDYTSRSELVEKDKRKESLQSKQLEQNKDLECNNIQITLKVPNKPDSDTGGTPKKPNRRRTSSVFYNLRSKDRNLSSSSSNLNDSAKQSVQHNKSKPKKNLSQVQDERDEGNNDQSILVSRKQAAKDMDKNQNCPQISSDGVTVSALDKPKSSTKNEKQKKSEVRKKYNSNRENIESNFFTSLNLQKNSVVNVDDYSNVVKTQTYSQSCGSETLTGNSNSKINTDSDVDFKQKNVSKFARHISTSCEAENFTETQELNLSNSASYANDSYAGEEYFLEDEYYKEEEPAGVDDEIQMLIKQIFDETKQSFSSVNKFCEETFRDLKEVSCSKNKKDEIHGKAVNAHIYLTRLNRALYSIFHRESDESENDFQSLLSNAGFKHKDLGNKILNEYSNAVAWFLDQANILLDAVNIIINALHP